jgi:hypothetical protein
MSYSMHRIYCASPGGLAVERRSFYDLIGEFNEAAAMQRGLLFVPVSLPDNTIDKRPAQREIDRNIRDCRYYVQLLDDTWGSPAMNFEHEYRLAVECAADEALPLQEVAVLCRKPATPAAEEFQRSLGNVEYSVFSSLPEYEQQLKDLLSRWLESFGEAA